MNTVPREKRSRDPEDQEERATKKAKLNYAEIYDLPEELVMQILAQVPKKNLVTLSLVSKQWLQIARSRDFWKLSCNQKWPMDESQFNGFGITIPTITVNGNALVDWKFLYYLRTKLRKMNKQFSALAKQNNDSGVLESLAEQSAKCIDIFFVSLLPHFARYLLHGKISDELRLTCCILLCDLGLIFYIKNLPDMALIMLSTLKSFVKNFPPRTFQSTAQPQTSFRLCRNLLQFCQEIQDKDPTLLLDNALPTIVQIFQLLFVDERTKKLLGLLTKFMIHLGTLKLGQVERQDELKFQFPLGKNIALLNDLLAKNEDLSTIIIDTATQVYNNSGDNWKMKASAICVAWIPEITKKRWINKYYELAMKAFADCNSNVSFAGLVGLNNLVQQKDMRLRLNDKQRSDVFYAHTDAFIRSPSLVIELYRSMLTLLKDNKIILLSGKTRLNEFTSKMVMIFAQLKDLSEDQRHIAYDFHLFGSVFKSRFSHTLEQVKAAFFESVQAGLLVPEKSLASYVQFGVSVKGPAFASEFRQLAKQIVDGTLPFKVSLLECYAQFGALWFQFSESDERDQIVNALLTAIPEEVYEYGQRLFFPHHIQDQIDLPRLKEDLFNEHTFDLHQLQVTYSAPQKKKNIVPRSVAKTDLVKQKGYRHNHDLNTLPDNAMMSFNFARQLSLIVTQQGKKYLKHAQNVLHALLAMEFGVPDHKLIEWLPSVASLMEIISENMEPKDLLNYTDTVLRVLENLIKQKGSQTQDELALQLFYSCFDTLINLAPYVQANHLATIIGTYVKLLEKEVQITLNLAEFIRLVSLTWPRLTPGAVHFTSLPLDDYIDLDPPHSTPSLNVYASLSALYGFDCMLRVLEIDEDYQADVIHYCKQIYVAATSGLTALSETDLTFLRILLVQNAAHRINPRTGKIGIIPKTGPRGITALKKAIEDDTFDTGVEELNEHVKSLDIDGICKFMFVNRKEEDSEEEEEDDEEASNMTDE